METVETALEVLSRAATMVHHRKYPGPEPADDTDNAGNNSPVESKSNSPPEIESLSASVKCMSKRRKGRAFSPRFRNLYTKDVSSPGNKAERSHSFNDKSTVPNALSEKINQLRSNSFNEKAKPKNLSDKIKELQRKYKKLHHSDTDLNNESNDFSDSDSNPSQKAKNSKLSDCTESPIDMSVKIRSSPPSYSQSINSGIHRPSVITQASNKINANFKNDVNKPDIGGKGEYTPGSMSMCDPVIDEHFRRSLGADYVALFGKSNEISTIVNDKSQKPSTKDRGSSPIMFARDPCIKYLKPKYTLNDLTIKSENNESEKIEEVKMDVDESSGLTVDDHFAKALGDTWKKLKENPINNRTVENSEKNESEK